VSAVSVVMPTFNCSDKLASVLDCLLASDHEGLDEIEVVVVDDGSRIPARSIVLSRKVSSPFTLACVYQANAGPAAARNKGYRNTQHNIVLFIDDDILVPPSLVKQHVRAHELHPGAVIFGHCRPISESQLMYSMTPDERGQVRAVVPDQWYSTMFQGHRRTPDASGTKSRRHSETNLLTFLESLDPRRSRQQRRDEFEPMSVVASGHISVERAVLGDGVYSVDLQTPAAEEFALSERLLRAGIPILQAADIEALHWTDMKIGTICRQQYKHGFGCAEVACKYPRCLNLPELRNTLSANGYPEPGTSWKRRARSLLASYPVRSGLLHISSLVDRFVPFYGINAAFYRTTIGAHYIAGIKDGMLRFGKASI
jgi:glycosyltransferase involved in cell wall biosynthesis